MGERAFLRIALAQINTTVGDLPGNRALVEEAYARAIRAGATLVVFPELTLTGYPPEDLLLKPSFLEDARAALEQLAPRVTHGLVLVGFAEPSAEGPRNGAALLAAGAIRGVYHKCTLPNYGVFDERRYFEPGKRCPIYVLGPWRIAVNICEDLWVRDGVPRLQACEGRANLMVNLSASPYHARKGPERERLFVDVARDFRLPLVYVNLVGGQDELVFDGQSLVVDASGTVLARAPQFASSLQYVDLPVPPGAGTGPRDAARDGDGAAPCATGGNSEYTRGALRLEEVRLDAELVPEVCRPTRPAHDPPGDATQGLGHVHPELGDEEEVYRALILGLRDYVQKNAFPGVVIGLSGGIDSALTAVVAADALSPEAVVGISMPSAYTSESAREGAASLARNLGIRFHEIPIHAMFDRVIEDLAPLLAGGQPDVTEENIQARLRGMLLMAFSNRLGHLVLATGNKSEVAVGYCTLYGDMVGGFSVLKDVLKSQVYTLARWRNVQSPGAGAIPEDTLTRPPSAELKPEQLDTDSLPDYAILDPIVRALVEEERSPRELVASGFERETVDRIFRMIQGNEYKRRQAAPGIKITPRSFGKDRRYPLTNRYRPRQT